MFLYSEEEERYLDDYDFYVSSTKEWQNAKDFSEFNFIERFLYRKLLSKLHGVKLRYKKFLVYPKKGLP
jgi:hypothetical protein